MVPKRPSNLARHLAARYMALSLVLTFLAAAGCDQPADPSLSVSPDAKSPTVVSLSPAATQMLIDMGKRGHLIGVGQFDQAESLGLPTCGTYNRPDIERLIAMSPDLIITQPDAGRTPAKLQKLANDGQFDLLVVPHAHSIAEVSQALTHPERGLGEAMGDVKAAEQTERAMRQQLQMIEQAMADVDRPRVLMVLNADQLGVIGSGTSHDELLRIAGGVNAVAEFESPYIQLSRSQVQAVVKPDVILLIQPNGPPLVDDDARLRAFKGLDIPAMREGRLYLIDHPQALLPATTFPRVAAQIAKALHPDQADAVQQALDGAQP